MVGKVVAWKSDRGFGFIEGVNGQDVFLHVTELRPGTLPHLVRTGAEMDFEMIETSRGLKATDATLAGARPLKVARPSLDGEGPDDGMCDVLPEGDLRAEVDRLLAAAAEGMLKLARGHGWVE